MWVENIWIANALSSVGPRVTVYPILDRRELEISGFGVVPRSRSRNATRSHAPARVRKFVRIEDRVDAVDAVALKIEADRREQRTARLQ
jgi:hypothetical protein